MSLLYVPHPLYMLVQLLLSAAEPDDPQDAIVAKQVSESVRLLIPECCCVMIFSFSFKLIIVHLAHNR